MIAGISLLAVATAGMVLRVTLRDRVPYLATVYYALPLPVITTFAAASTGLLLRHRRIPFRAAIAVFAAAALWTGLTHFGWRTSADASSGVRVVFWNVSRGVRGWNEIS